VASTLTLLLALGATGAFLLLRERASEAATVDQSRAEAPAAPVPPVRPSPPQVPPARPVPVVPPAPPKKKDDPGPPSTPRPPFPDYPTPLSVNETVTVDGVGDAKCAMEIKVNPAAYAGLKKMVPDVAVLLQRIGLCQKQWLEVENVRGAYADATCKVFLEWTIRGLARTRSDVDWEVPLLDGAGWKPLQHQGNLAVFDLRPQGSPVLDRMTQFLLGNMRGTVHVIVPRKAQNLQLASAPARLRFRLPAAPAAGKKPAVAFRLQARKWLMSCLAKSYGNPRFSRLWTARALLTNTGDQPVTDYRVRFRLVGYTAAWSSWQRCARVAPGQTVVDAFFPVLDLDRLARVNSTHPAQLEVEYQYRQADGRLVQDTEGQPLKVLGRNDAVYGSRPSSKDMDWYDKYDNAPLIVASFVTYNDPVIQQVAGWVSGMAGGSTSTDEAAARRFMQALFEFMGANVAYQTSPGGAVDGHFFQHVKYGRDVLRNRAGTCIDLAIFYASVCEAVGLPAVLYLIPGHCFPAVVVPGNKLVGVEATMIGQASFDEAVATACQNIAGVKQGKINAYEVVVRTFHALGVGSLELPTVPPSVLRDWGIRNQRVAANASQRENGRSAAPATATVWVNQAVIGGRPLVQAFCLKSDGTFEHCVVDQGRRIKLQEEGFFTCVGGVLKFYNVRGVLLEVGAIKPVSANQFVYHILGSRYVPASVGMQLVFTRMQ
jgi:hypothetical protein